MVLSEIPILGRTIKKINKGIKNEGLQATVAKMFDKTNTKLLVYGKNRNLFLILKKHPVIVVANHPSEADVLVLLAGLENRIDNNLIINNSFTNIFSELDKHLIPVYINSRIAEKRNIDSKLLKLFQTFHNTNIYKHEEEHQKNIESIKIATNKLNHGGLVAIFPGGGGENGKWFSGVGHMIKGVRSLNKVYIIKAYIEGTSRWDFLRIIPGMSKFMPDYKISFDQASKLNRFEFLSAKETANNLESEYYQWVSKLKDKEIKKTFRWPICEKFYILARSLVIWLMIKPY